MCALINSDLGWLMYLREAGDAGFSSRNLKYDGPPDAKLDYFLSNGQQDEYPKAWALPIEEVRRALEYFEREQKRPPFITWHNDSGEDMKTP
jgi:Immunity protein Imm1